MESNELVADNVVARGKRGGKPELVGLVDNHVIGGPGAVGALALLGDLEPDLLSAGVVVLAVTRAAGEVGGSGATVRVGPGGPEEGNLGAGLSGGGERGRGAAAVLPATTLDVDGSHILQWH